ncbi:hypothetical protein OH77DRAFT_951533 [Trametes cingulata]|nr:hypothetical protein OH77DRAFT_951533 [Trametes cingulata]
MNENWTPRPGLSRTCSRSQLRPGSRRRGRPADHLRTKKKKISFRSVYARLSWFRCCTVGMPERPGSQHPHRHPTMTQASPIPLSKNMARPPPDGRPGRRCFSPSLSGIRVGAGVGVGVGDAQAETTPFVSAIPTVLHTTEPNRGAPPEPPPPRGVVSRPPQMLGVRLMRDVPAHAAAEIIRQILASLVKSSCEARSSSWLTG